MSQMSESQNFTILIVDSDVLVRMPLAEYLRECGYRVLESANSDEAIDVLKRNDPKVDVVIADPRNASSGTTGFDIAKWIHENRPGVEVMFSGTPQRAAAVAGDLSAEGPDPAPSHPQLLEQRIRELRASRKQ